MDDMQLASFKIISAVGMAKSYYIEAIRSSENDGTSYQKKVIL